MAITEAEGKLIDLLVELSDRRDLLIPMVIKARQRNMTEELIAFIENNHVDDIEQVAEYIWPPAAEEALVDVSWRNKDYMAVISISSFPVHEDEFPNYLKILTYVQQREDVSAVLKISGSDEFREILVSYTGSLYYVEINCPMDYFGCTHPLLLASDNLTYDQAAEVLYSILVEGREDTSLMEEHFQEISSRIYPV